MHPTEASDETVRNQLEKILSSPTFARSDRLSKFLRFVVEQQLQGKAAEVKESLVGIEVFGRKPGYDPRQDLVVRTEAAKLRTRLSQYYTGGAPRTRSYRAAQGWLHAGVPPARGSGNRCITLLVQNIALAHDPACLPGAGPGSEWVVVGAIQERADSDCGATVEQPERRPGQRLLCRRSDRRDYPRPVGH